MAVVNHACNERKLRIKPSAHRSAFQAPPAEEAVAQSSALWERRDGASVDADLLRTANEPHARCSEGGRAPYPDSKLRGEKYEPFDHPHPQCSGRAVGHGDWSSLALHLGPWLRGVGAEEGQFDRGSCFESASGTRSPPRLASPLLAVSPATPGRPHSLFLSWPREFHVHLPVLGHFSPGTSSRQLSCLR